MTVFQDASSQGVGALDTMIDIIHGKPVQKKIFTKLELVTPKNMAEYAKK